MSALLIGPASHPTGPAAAPMDVEVWHGVMGLGMALMLLTSLSVGVARLALVIFGGGVA